MFFRVAPIVIGNSRDELPPIVIVVARPCQSTYPKRSTRIYSSADNKAKEQIVEWKKALMMA